MKGMLGAGEFCFPDLLTRVRGSEQPVEKVGIELIATINRVPKAPKSAYLMPDLG
jgi:hypothetical protein